MVDPLIWLTFGAAIIGMLTLDLVLERRTAGAVPSMRASAIWSGVWTLVALAFALILLPWREIVPSAASNVGLRSAPASCRSRRCVRTTACRSRVARSVRVEVIGTAN